MKTSLDPKYSSMNKNSWHLWRQITTNLCCKHYSNYLRPIEIPVRVENFDVAAGTVKSIHGSGAPN